MAGFSDASRLLDEQVEAHLGDPAVYRVQGAGVGVTILAMLNRPSNTIQIREAAFVAEQPVIEVRVATVPGLRSGDTFDMDGRVWRVEGAPQRPDDGAWWLATVADVGAAA